MHWYLYQPVAFLILQYARFKLHGTKDIQKEAEEFYKNTTADRLPIEAIAWILSVLAGGKHRSPLADEIVRYLHNHVNINETSGAGRFYSYYEEITRHTIFHSEERTDAVVSILSIILRMLVTFRLWRL
jgi:hypothetical protein